MNSNSQLLVLLVGVHVCMYVLLNKTRVQSGGRLAAVRPGPQSFPQRLQSPRSALPRAGGTIEVLLAGSCMRLPPR